MTAMEIAPIYDQTCRDLGWDPMRPDINEQSQRAVAKAKRRQCRKWWRRAR